MNLPKTNEYAKAYVEILEVINKIDKEYKDKIPEKLLDFFENNKDLKYEFKVENMNSQKPFLRETVVILTVLEQKYWANDEEREILNRVLKENEEKHQKEIREKYNPNRIFEKSKKEKVEEEINNKEQTSLSEVKENIFVKIKKMIKEFFNK